MASMGRKRAIRVGMGSRLLNASIDGHGRVHHLLVVTGKDAHIYLLNQKNIGKFNAGSNNSYQEIYNAKRLWRLVLGRVF